MSSQSPKKYLFDSLIEFITSGCLAYKKLLLCQRDRALNAWDCCDLLKPWDEPHGSSQKSPLDDTYF